MAQKVKCNNCGKWFYVVEFPMGVPGGKEREEYSCPYCHQEAGHITTDGFVRVQKIEPQPKDNE